VYLQQSSISPAHTTVKPSPQLTDIKPPLTPTSTIKPTSTHRKHKHTSQHPSTNNNNDHNMIDLKHATLQFNSAQQSTREQLMDMVMSQAAAVMMQQQQQPTGPAQFSQQVEVEYLT
jgi:hypothetical protein